MKILVIGSNGQVGTELGQKLWDEMYAQSNEEIAFKVNAIAVGEMARYCHATGCCLMHVSTDYVFDGKSVVPYLETDSEAPIGIYGQSKLAGERIIRETLDRHIILRTSWVFGLTGSNFVKTMLRLSEKKTDINVVSDQFGAPTSARAIAGSILAIIAECSSAPKSHDFWGTYHFSGWPFVSWADFANEIFEQAVSREIISHRPNVSPISTAGYPTPATRPVNSKLDCSKLKRTFGIDPDDWRRSLGLMLDEVKEELFN